MRIAEVRATSLDMRIDVTEIVRTSIKTDKQDQLWKFVREITGHTDYAIGSENRRIVFIGSTHLTRYSKNFRAKDELLIEYEAVHDETFQVTRAALAYRIEK